MSEEQKHLTPDEQVVLDSVRLSSALVSAAQKIIDRLKYIGDMDDKELLNTAKSISSLSATVAMNHATVIKNTISLRDSYLKQEALKSLRGHGASSAAKRFPQPPPLPQTFDNEKTQKPQQTSEQNVEIIDQSADGNMQKHGEEMA